MSDVSTVCDKCKGVVYPDFEHDCEGPPPKWSEEPPTEVGYYWAQFPDEIGVATEPVQLSMNGDYHWVSVINGLATFSPSEVIKWGPRIQFPPLPEED